MHPKYTPVILLAASFFFLSGSLLFGQILGKTTGISLTYHRIQSESFYTNFGDQLIRTKNIGVNDFFPQFTIDMGVRQSFNYGLYTNYEIRWIPNYQISLSEYEDDNDDFYYDSDFFYMDAAVTGEIGIYLFKNLFKRSLVKEESNHWFINNSISLLSGIDIHGPAFMILGCKRKYDNYKLSAKADFNDILFTRKFHFNAYAGIGFMFNEVEFNIRYYIFSSRLQGLDNVPSLVYKPIISVSMRAIVY